MAKLVAIGDSITQGFQSGAILKTEWSYPAMIARTLGLSVPTDFRIPSFFGSGLPINIEELLQSMAPTLGNEISTGEWIFRFPFLLERFIDDIEELYERGRGSKPSIFKSQFHNLAVWGFRVVDAFSVHSDYCDRVIQAREGLIENDFLGLPNAPMYRTAKTVLNPAEIVSKKQWTQIENLQAITNEEGVENLILWLGANDCLGTVTSLKLDRMPSDFASEDPEERRKFNLTHPGIFEKDYKILVAKVKEAISPNTRVFVGTIPYVTIPPITQGIGKLPANSKYFEYYGRFFSNENNFNPFFNSKLTGEEIKSIDKTIDEFNQIIRDEVNLAGNNWHLVDAGEILNSLAVKRSHLINSPEEPLKAYYRSLGLSDHPLLRLDPIPNTLLLETQDRTRKSGGLFSLDSVHPSTIGYGILAEAFLREMQAAGVPDANPSHLDWRQIIAQDSLLQSPPVLWDDIINAAEGNSI
uniref:SGNH/GDSL hydrolase family protein n=1 Tax=Chamaesiphon sp. TaxID=2814140 RepID=UPI003593DDA5